MTYILTVNNQSYSLTPRPHDIFIALNDGKSEYSVFNYPKDDPCHMAEDQRLNSIHKRQLAPIGLFDSGAGGLTILSALRQERPNEDYIFFGDTAHCPYGNRNEANITDLSLRAGQFLVDQGAKLMIVACNTASQIALSVLRATFSIPIVGIVPAVKPAARLTKRGRIGILATNRTVQTAYLQHLVAEFASDIEVHAVGCPELVTLVERGELEGAEVEEQLRFSLAPLLAKDIDVIVLGCTHFPALRTAIEHVVGDTIQVIDSSTAIVRRTQSILDTEGLIRPSSFKKNGSLQIWCSGDPSTFDNVASSILGYTVTVHHFSALNFNTLKRIEEGDGYYHA